MALYLKDIFAAIAVVFNAIPMAMFSLSYGFAAFPTALGFIVGGFGMLLTHQIAPISLQAESIVLAGTISHDRNERLNIIFYSGIVMAILGLCGVLTKTMDFIGPCILNAMLAGVGLMLAKTEQIRFRNIYGIGNNRLFCNQRSYLDDRSFCYYQRYCTPYQSQSDRPPGSSAGGRHE